MLNIIKEQEETKQSDALEKKSTYVEYVFEDEATYDSFLEIEALRGHYTTGYQLFSIIPDTRKEDCLLSVDAAVDSEEKKLPAMLFIWKPIAGGAHYQQVNIGISGKLNREAVSEALEAHGLKKDKETSIVEIQLEREKSVDGKPTSTNIFSCLFPCRQKHREKHAPLSQRESIEMNAV